MHRTHPRGSVLALLGAAVLATGASAADVSVGGLATNGWYSDDTRADGTAAVPEAVGTNLVSPTLTDAPEGPGGSADHTDDILNQISFGTATGSVPSGTHPGSVRMTIASGTGAGGKSQISHRKDDATGHAFGSALADTGFFVDYAWRGDGTSTITASFKIGIRTAEAGGTGSSSRTGENVWDKVLIYEPGQGNGGTSDGTWQTESVTRTSGVWWFFDRTVGASSQSMPMTLADMSTSTATYSGTRTIQDVYDLITDPAAVITSVQFGIGSNNPGGDVQVNQLATSFYRPGDTVTFGEATEVSLVAQDDCLSAGEQMVMEIQLSNPNGEMVTGSQTFLSFDPTLVEVDLGAGAGAGTTDPFDQVPFFFDVDNVAGTATLANGDPSGVIFTTEDAVIGTITFTPLVEFCSIEDVVTIVTNPSGPTSNLVGVGGAIPITAVFNDLGPLTSDVTAPVVFAVDLSVDGGGGPDLVVMDGDDAALSELTVPDLVSGDGFTGTGSWADSATGGTFLYLPIHTLGRPFTIDEIASISYHTKDDASDALDWFFAIYTAPDGIDDDASWYGHRLTSEPEYAIGASETVGAWNEWNTDDDDANEITFYDTNHGTGFGFPSPPTLTDLQAGPIDWNAYNGAADVTNIDYGPEEVRLISVATGSGWDPAWDGQIDSFTIELTTGETILIDFEAEGISTDLDANCQATINYSAVVGDNCAIDAGSVTVTASSGTSTVNVDSVVLTPGTLGTTIVTGTISVAGSSGCTTTVTVDVDVADTCGTPAITGTAGIDLDDVTAPVISGIPSDIFVPADAGTCDAVVSWTPPTAVDGCAGSITPTSTHLPGDVFPGGTTTVTYFFDDGCGNVSMTSFDVTVASTSILSLDVDLFSGTTNTFDRCLEITFTGVDTTAVSTTVTFVAGAGSTTIAIPCGDYDCATITDPLHSLASSVPMTISGTEYAAEALNVDGNGLILGNLNGDTFIDILDFGVYVSQFGATYGGAVDTPCGFVGPHADLDGDAFVDAADFTSIQISFLEIGDGGCGAPDAGPTRGNRSGRRQALDATAGPMRAISTAELRRRGLGHLVRADVNRDGWVDERDIVAFFGG